MKSDLSFALHRIANHPERILTAMFVVVLAFLVINPLIEIIHDSLVYQSYDLAYFPDAKEGEFTLFHMTRVFTGRLSNSLFYRPFVNSLMIASGVTALSLFIGTILAWLLVRTDLHFRPAFTALAVVPYMMPSWILALAWLTLFKNDRVGGAEGMFTFFFGIQTPNWLAYGMFPIIICLALHYYAYAFLLMSGALMTVDSELEEAGAICGLSRFRRLAKITFPLLLPALGSAVVLTFIRILGTFGTPALLGLPVQFYTISTRIYASLNARNMGDGFVLALVLVVMAIIFIYVNSRILGVRKSFVTLTGKGFRQRPISLGAWRLPLTAVVALFMAVTVFMPLLILAWETFMLDPGDYSFENYTTHFWVGESDYELASGEEGIIHNDNILSSLWNSIKLAVSAAIFNGLLGILIGYAIVRGRGTKLSKLLEGMAFAPYIFPSIALGAIYLGMFSTDFGPIPALYGTFALLVVITTVKNLPFSSRTGIAAMLQIDKSLEETARVQGIGWFRRMWKIIIPMSTSGLMAGMLLTFITAMRELSLIILLVTPSTMVMTTVIFAYQEQDATQHANGVTLILILIIIFANILVRRLFGSSSIFGLRQT
ncbi:MAG: iron ABC transporter permease [Rhodospirillales bacterium]|jgi:iron(III) transport system permease protein|nr:iron ABC transporter permease [Rhodospirillales bacterium]